MHCQTGYYTHAWLMFQLPAKWESKLYIYSLILSEPSDSEAGAKGGPAKKRQAAKQQKQKEKSKPNVTKDKEGNTMEEGPKSHFYAEGKNTTVPSLQIPPGIRKLEKASATQTPSHREIQTDTDTHTHTHTCTYTHTTHTHTHTHTNNIFSKFYRCKTIWLSCVGFPMLWRCA